jgi:hypothetical protein
MRPARLAAAAAATVLFVSLASPGGSPASAAPAPGGPTEELARKLGMQLVPKGSAATRKAGAAPADPAVSLLPDPTKVDYSYWKSVAKQKSKARAAAAAKKAAATKAAVEPLLVDEAEPDTIRGGNDTTATAQYIPQFGTAAGKRPAARILGTLAPGPAPATLPTVPEDNGSIPLAGETGLTSGRTVVTEGTIGDGPHGSAGDGTGDFDFYAIRGAAAGDRLVADIATDAASNLDSMLILYNAAGDEVAFNDDDASSLDSLLSVRIPAAGDYFLAVAGFPNLPFDPFDSGSGDGAGSEGDYSLTLGRNASDVDVFAVNLRAGDVLSGSVTGAGTSLQVFDTAGTEVFGSTQDASYIYPASTPLTGGGNAVVDHVAKAGGRHYIAVTGGTGNYDITVEGRRSGPVLKKTTQTIFLDFDGARLNTAIFGGPGVRTLSPLSAFLGRWGLTASQENALINRIVATTTENLKHDFAGTGVEVRILNSRDHADPFGRPNVSRLIVGGTIDESGIQTIGIAQSIDPGNYALDESALILLDVVSGDVDEWGDASFNYYLTPASDRVKFVGTALGNIASHEAGHYLGNWHVDQFNDVLNLMDQGGNFPLLYGVGPDGIGGTADDPDVDFGPDELNPNEGFTGIEDTYTRVRWALARPS